MFMKRYLKAKIETLNGFYLHLYSFFIYLFSLRLIETNRGCAYEKGAGRLVHNHEIHPGGTHEIWDIEDLANVGKGFLSGFWVRIRNSGDDPHLIRKGFCWMSIFCLKTINEKS